MTTQRQMRRTFLVCLFLLASFPAVAARAFIDRVNGLPFVVGMLVPSVSTFDGHVDSPVTANVGVFTVDAQGNSCNAGNRNMFGATLFSVPMNQPGWAKCFQVASGTVQTFQVKLDLMDCTHMSFPDFSCDHTYTYYNLTVGAAPPPPPPSLSCYITPATSSHYISEKATLTAICDQPGANYLWTGCTGIGNTCTANFSAIGINSYLLQATIPGATANATAMIAWVQTLPPTANGILTAVEYYHAGLDHYFMTAMQAENDALDSGKFLGWVRTGYSWKVAKAGTNAPGSSPVCRFYGNPAHGLDTHFYSASPVECATLVEKWPSQWFKESDDVFEVNLPNANTGACPSNTSPLYRAWNNRADTNHRYSTQPHVILEMVAKGYVAEGYGPANPPPIMCVPE
jgi:hypothetical protein